MNGNENENRFEDLSLEAADLPSILLTMEKWSWNAHHANVQADIEQGEDVLVEKAQRPRTPEIFILMVDITRILVTGETVRVLNPRRYHALRGIYNIREAGRVSVFESGTAWTRRISPTVRWIPTLPFED